MNNTQKIQEIGKLTNVAGGNLMFSETDLLFANEFVADTFSDVPKDQANSYAQYREDKNQQVVKKNKLNVVKKMNEPIVTTLPDRQKRYAANIPNISPLLPGPVSLGTSSSKTVEVKRKIFIDSKHRNKILYPDASDFVISWGRTFQNVKRIQLISLEFPNVVPTVIAGANNMLYWQNLEDADLNPVFPEYTASVATGSYTLTTLQTELTNDMKLLRRHASVQNLDGTFPPKHEFIVETNQETDYVGFTSIIAQPAPNNPITTVGGSSVIIFKQANHGYNDQERVHILGVMGLIGGLQATDLNGAYYITKVDNDTFTFEVQAVAFTSATGGGTLVKTGREAPFQFLFGNHKDSIADIIGFPEENSSVDVGITDPLTSGIKSITGVIPGDIYTQIICPDHRLQDGDRIYLWNFFVSPSVYENDIHKGMFEVYAVQSPDVFLIKYTTYLVSDISSAYVGTQVFNMYYPNHGFNRIVDIQQSAFNQVRITTLFDHNFTEKSKVRITGTNSAPSVDGYYTPIPVDSDSFIISSADLSNPLSITTSGFKGILSSDYTFYLYNVQPFGGFTANDLNGVPFEVRDIIDADNFTLVGRYGYSQIGETGGGGNIRINSKLHGWRGTQDNSPGGTLFKPVRLSGDNYAFMCVPELNSDSIATTGPVKNIFAKILITAVPGVIIFNAFDASPIDFPKPLSILNELRFSIRTGDNYSVSFGGLDYSFGLEVTELVQLDENNQIQSNPMPPPK
jgi:hypothetical protein